MDGLSAAASVIAVIQISAQVFDLCRTYYLNVKDARKDIERLRNEITSLQDILVNVVDLANTPAPGFLQTLKLINQDEGPLKQCHVELTALLAKLEPEDSTSKLKLALRSLKWPLKTKDVDKALLAIGRYKSSFVLALTTDQTSLSLAIGRDVSEIKHQIETQRIDDDRQAIINWLSTTDPSVNYHASCRKCEPETGRWLIDREDFKEWKTTANSFMWLLGIPGCGKTILSSTIIKHLKEHCEANLNHAVAYFYFDFKTASKQEVSACISSLLAQLCTQADTLPQTIVQAHGHCSKGNLRPNLSELVELLGNIIKVLDNVYIVIDALDECPKDGERAQLLATISDVKSLSAENLHVLATSRRESDIEEILLPLVTIPAISLQGSHVDLDIQLHISRQLDTDSKLKKWSNEVKKEIETTLMAGANGMFRWVLCQLDVLKKCLKVSMIREALRNLPKTLDDTYTRLLLEIDSVYRQEAKTALSWLAFSERPLRLTELAEAIIINPDREPPLDPEERFPDPRNVLEILSSLVTLSGASGTIVTLAHFSVKEYLVSEQIERSPAHQFAVSNAATHNLIAKSCLVYILYYCNKARDLGFPTLTAFPLLRYGSYYWHIHIRHSNIEQQKALTSYALNLLLSASAMSRLDLQRIDIRRAESSRHRPVLTYHGSPSANALGNGSALGLLNVVQELISRGYDPNSMSAPNSPLRRAIRGHHEDVVCLLLKSGADVNNKDRVGYIPLHDAAREGQISIVQSILDFGGDVNASDEAGETPLHLAVYNSHDSIARLLVESGARVEVGTVRTGQTPFHWAAFDNSPSLVDFFLEHGADINARNRGGETALHYAASHEHPILQHLLDLGANLEIETNEGATPLYWAAARDSEQAMSMLIEAGAKYLPTLLTLANNRSHSGFQRLLTYCVTNDKSPLNWSELQGCGRGEYGLCNECRRIVSQNLEILGNFEHLLPMRTLEKRDTPVEGYI